MPKKQPSLPDIARREIMDGYVYCYDSNGRRCLDTKKRERIILAHDFRVYSPNLHIGALGWTVPDSTDGYTFADVRFDSGETLRLKSYAFERVEIDSEIAKQIELLTRYRNTRFDADPKVAALCREAWINENYAPYMSLIGTILQGTGDQELYAFTFPSLKELADLKGDLHYPVKIGYSKNSSDGAYGRIRSQISEKAAYPEKPEVLCICKVWDGRDLETQMHTRLRTLGRRVSHSLGKEWFLTSTAEILETLRECTYRPFPADRIISGADETLEDCFLGLLANGATIEMGVVPGQSAVAIGVRYLEERAAQNNPAESRTPGICD